MIPDKRVRDVAHKPSDGARPARTPPPAHQNRPAAPDNELFGFVQKLAADLQGDLELPGFPDVVMRLHRALGDERSSVKEIVRLISSEPSLSARLVHLANSAAFNTGDRAVSDLRTAITVLGFNLVRSTATAFAMRQLEQQEWLKPLRPHLARVWQESISVAAICYTASRRVEGTRPDEALAAGLFHQLGSLYVLTRARREGVDVGSETDWAVTIADWHPAIARAIIENWGMSASLGEAVEDQDALRNLAPGELAALPLLSRLMAASKVYHVVMNTAGQDQSAAQALLAPVRFGGQPYVELVSPVHDEIAAVSQVIAR